MHVSRKERNPFYIKLENAVVYLQKEEEIFVSIRKLGWDEQLG